MRSLRTPAPMCWALWGPPGVSNKYIDPSWSALEKHFFRKKSIIEVLRAQKKHVLNLQIIITFNQKITKHAFLSPQILDYILIFLKNLFETTSTGYKHLSANSRIYIRLFIGIIKVLRARKAIIRNYQNIYILKPTYTPLSISIMYYSRHRQVITSTR